MDRPVFRSVDKYQIHGYREYIRNHPQSPMPSDGYVIQDLDMMILGFGPRFKTDRKGRFIEIELKFGNKALTFGQISAFGLRDVLMRKGDPEGKHYQGFYIVNYDNDDWSLANFKVNGVSVSRATFDKFLLLELDAPGLPKALDFNAELKRWMEQKWPKK